MIWIEESLEVMIKHQHTFLRIILVRYQYPFICSIFTKTRESDH